MTNQKATLQFVLADLSENCGRIILPLPQPGNLLFLLVLDNLSPHKKVPSLTWMDTEVFSEVIFHMDHQNNLIYHVQWRPTAEGKYELLHLVMECLKCLAMILKPQSLSLGKPASLTGAQGL